MKQRVVLVDYGSGNLRSAAKALERAAAEADLDRQIVVSGKPADVRKADRVVLPGVGAFGDCRQGLNAVEGMVEALNDAANRRAVPLLGICVGMQLMADEGLEHGHHRGLGWIAGRVVALRPDDRSLKIPHMGWNTVQLTPTGGSHAVASGLSGGPHVYFVHGFHFETTKPEHCLATTGYGGTVTAIIGRDNIVGTQFHPEKSQKAGLRFLTQFLEWTP